MQNLFYVKNKYYILRYDSHIKLNKCEKVDTYEKCLEIVEKNLIKNDFSCDIKDNNKPIINTKLINNKLKDTIKTYSFNIIKYEPKLSGFVFNIGIVIWNNKTNEFSYKFLDDKLISKLANIMKVDFIFDIKKHFTDFYNQKDLTILDVKKDIVKIQNYPLEYNYKYDTWNYWNQYDSSDFNKVINDVFNSEVDFIFKKN